MFGTLEGLWTLAWKRRIPVSPGAPGESVGRGEKGGEWKETRSKEEEEEEYGRRGGVRRTRRRSMEEEEEEEEEEED
jgi:hypothetical protein